MNQNNPGQYSSIPVNKTIPQPSQATLRRLKKESQENYKKFEIWNLDCLYPKSAISNDKGSPLLTEARRDGCRSRSKIIAMKTGRRVS